MAKILIYKEVVPNGEYDIFRTIDYKKFRNEVDEASCYNVGNRAWLQGIIVALNDGYNELVFLRKDMTADYINSEFDYVVLPMANIFQTRYILAMSNLTEFFSRIAIPTYVISCGAQAPSFDGLKELIESVKQPASEFIKTIYATGGEFALRGFFTKEFFSQLGFNSAVVTGCPSMYQFGSQLKIEKKPSADLIRPVYNGNLDILGKELLQSRDAVYLDQDQYYGLIFALNAPEDPMNADKYIKYLVKEYGFDIVKLAMERRAVLFLDISVWMHYLTEKGFNFSYGTRIHGNIVSILSGIPALICACDSRTREMAEFFSIPMIEPAGANKTLEELYNLTDYNKFNSRFQSNYQRFEEFLIKCGLVKRIGVNNIFHTEDTSLVYVNWMQTLLEPYRAAFEKNKNRLRGYDEINRTIAGVGRKIRKLLH